MEIWKDILGYETKYQISNLGRVKSLQKKVGNGKGYIKPEIILTNIIMMGGYYCVNLKNPVCIHKLLAVHFIH